MLTLKNSVRATLVAASSFASVAALAACGQSRDNVTVSAGTPAPAVTVEAFQAATASKSIRVPGSIHAQFDPPAPTDQPRISAATAFATYMKTMPPPGDWKSQKPTAMLSLFSSQDNGQSTITGGKPKFSKVLSWAIIYRNVPDSSSGPLPAPGVTRGGSGNQLQCSFAFMVDAATGEYMTAIEQCPGNF